MFINLQAFKIGKKTNFIWNFCNVIHIHIAEKMGKVVTNQMKTRKGESNRDCFEKKTFKNVIWVVGVEMQISKRCIHIQSKYQHQCKQLEKSRKSYLFQMFYSDLNERMIRLDFR